MIKLNMASIDCEARKAEQACTYYVRCSVSWTWPGTSRAIKGQLRDEIVAGLEADGMAVTASTRMFNWRQPALANISALKREATAFYHSNTIAWPEESGSRLLPKDRVERFESRMQDYRAELRQQARMVQEVREEIIERARAQRGKAFREEDYPTDLSTLFSLSWGFTSLVVSEELRNISENAFAAEKTRQMARVLGAVRMAEEMSIRELHTLAGRLASRLEAVDQQPPEGERRPPLYASTLEAVREFCQHYSAVICWGTDDLDEVVREAGDSVVGVSRDELKKDAEIRQQVATSMLRVASRLERFLPDLTVKQEQPSEMDVMDEEASTLLEASA